tara:strand:+ start:52171 stop:53871 length:1701 start_codon:yes stop_codon:yes gene_type:complete
LKKIILKNNQEVVKTIYWDDYFSENKNTISLSDYVEKNDIKLKQKLIDLLNSIEEQNKEIIKNFKITKDFNFWSLTNFCEKNLYKKNKFFELTKILAFDEIIKNENFSEAFIDIKDKNCEKILYKILNKKIKIKTFNIQEKLIFFFIELLSIIKGSYFIFSRYFINKNKRVFNKQYSLFISFFSHINADSFNNNIYKSLFWGNLKKIVNMNFLHMFIKNNINKNYSALNSGLENFSNKSEIHNFLDSYLKKKTVFKIIKKAITIKINYHFNKKKFEIKFNNYNITSALLFDLNRSFMFYNIIIKLYYFYLFENFFRENNFNNSCFYIHENQPWEKSLIYHWKKNNIKKIYGVISSSVRFWDLRFEKSNINPDILLSNGNDSFKKLQEFGFNKSELNIVESLRYKNITHSYSTINSQNKNVLVLLDYSNTSNKILIDILNKINFSENLQLTLKNHPLNEYKNNIKFNYSEFNKKKLNKNYDLVICTNRTTASVDYYLTGIKVAILIEPNYFNLSPLKGNDQCSFFYDHNDLDQILKNINNNKSDFRSDFFMIDSNYSKWKEILYNEK